MLFLLLKELFKIYFYFTAAGVEPCGSRKNASPYIIHSADFILFPSFEIRGYILNNQEILIGLDCCLDYVFNPLGHF